MGFFEEIVDWINKLATPVFVLFENYWLLLCLAAIGLMVFIIWWLWRLIL